MPTEPVLHVIEDPEDSRAVVDVITAVVERVGCCAALHPTPGLASSKQLAADLLVALGKRFDALAFERTGGRAWDLAQVWMEAEGVRHLFVLRAHRLDARRWRDLIDLATGGGTQLWFVVHPAVPERVQALAAGTGARRWDAHSFAARWQKEMEGVDAQPAEVKLPTVPAADFVTFRSACRRLLDAEGFERVDRVLRRSIERTSAELGPWKATPRRPTPPALGQADVAVQLQALLVDAQDATETLVRLRGAQAAYFREGWLVEFRPPLVPSDSGLTPLGPSLDRSMAARLRRLCVPRSTAAMALFLVADLRSVALSRLNLADVDHDAGAVADEGKRFTIPPYARSLVLAQIIERRRAGASAEDPFFSHPRTGGRPPPSALRNVLRGVAGKVGIAVGVYDSFGTARSASGWLGSRSLSLVALDRVPASYQ